MFLQHLFCANRKKRLLLCRMTAMSPLRARHTMGVRGRTGCTHGHSVPRECGYGGQNTHQPPYAFAVTSSWVREIEGYADEGCLSTWFPSICAACFYPRDLDRAYPAHCRHKPTLLLEVLGPNIRVSVSRGPVSRGQASQLHAHVSIEPKSRAILETSCSVPL